MKILILDPDPAVATGWVTLLQGGGFDPVMATAIEEVFFALGHETFDCLLVAPEALEGRDTEFFGQMQSQFPVVPVGLLVPAGAGGSWEHFSPYCSLGILEKPLDLQKVAELAGKLSGSESGVYHLDDLIASYCEHGMTGRITVRQGEQDGFVFLQDGAVIHAEFVGMSGEEALARLRAEDGPTLFYDENMTAPIQSIKKSWQELLGRASPELTASSSTQLVQEARDRQLIDKMVGPFKILRQLASDDWGVLYEADQVAVNRTVALKVLDPHWYGDQEKVYQFITFAANMAQVQNPYITAVFESGEGNGLIFYAREHLEPCSIPERIKAGKLLNEDLAIRTIIHVAEALSYEEKNQIAHSPLTADQILVPSVGVPKLANNVILQDAPSSAGSGDEISRLAGFIRYGLGPSTNISGDFNELLNRMMAARQTPAFGWVPLLQEMKALELKRNSMKAVRSQASTHLHAILPKKKEGNRGKQVVLAILALVMVALGAAYYFLTRTPGPGETHSMLKISGGGFVYQNGQPMTLPTFYMDQYEVTIGQYRKFLEAWRVNPGAIQEHPDLSSTKDHVPFEWEKMVEAINGKMIWNGGRLYDTSPIFNVDFYDAWAYAQWAGKRLPSEQEWERAARGPTGLFYPWGNESLAPNANTGADFMKVVSLPTPPDFGKIDGYGLWAPVGSMKMDQTKEGVMDLLGNVSEWTDSWDKHPEISTRRVPVIRGGNFIVKDPTLTGRELHQPASGRARWLGFRCVSDNPPQP